MPNLRQQLVALANSTVCWFGLGNRDGGDDAAGVRLAERLRSCHVANVSMPGLQPELSLAQARSVRPDHVVFLDAAAFGGQPGAVTFFDATRIQSLFPQISTHRIALSTVARMLLAETAASVWLLGIQPASLRPGHPLTPAVQLTIELLVHLIAECFAPAPEEIGRTARARPLESMNHDAVDA